MRCSKTMTYRRGGGVWRADDSDAEGGIDWVGKAQAGTDSGPVF